MDSNQRLVCLFISHAARTMENSAVEGTVSALADWQRAKGHTSVCLAETSKSEFPVGAFVRHHMEGIRSAGAREDQPLVSRGAKWPGGLGLSWRRETFTQRLRDLLSEVAGALVTAPFDATKFIP